jgi:hypothetical protein
MITVAEESTGILDDNGIGTAIIASTFPIGDAKYNKGGHENSIDDDDVENDVNAKAGNDGEKRGGGGGGEDEDESKVKGCGGDVTETGIIMAKWA